MTEVAVGVVLHTALGLALAALVWLVGRGCLVACRRPLEGRSLLDGYPLGLFVVMAAAVPPLLWRPLGALSALVVVAAIVAGVRNATLPLRGVTLALAGLGSAVFGGGLGLLLHGPTDDLDSAAYGGMLWYVAKVVSAAESIVPFRDPLVEGEKSIYSEAGTSFVGTVLSWLPGFDPILYHAATLPTFAAASLCIGLALFVNGRPVAPPLVGIAASLLAVAIVAYPSWITETPPAAFALPLVFSLWRVWRDELSTRWLVLLSAVVALDYFQTKVIAIMVLGLLLLAGLVERHRHRPDFRRVALIAAALLALGAAAVIGLLFAFASWYAGLAKPKTLPLDAVRGLTDGDPDVRSLGLVCLVVAEACRSPRLLALGPGVSSSRSPRRCCRRGFCPGTGSRSRSSAGCSSPRCCSSTGCGSTCGWRWSRGPCSRSPPLRESRSGRRPASCSSSRCWSRSARSRFAHRPSSAAALPQRP